MLFQADAVNVVPETVKNPNHLEIVTDTKITEMRKKSSRVF